jgi:integrase/recombinase XerD
LFESFVVPMLYPNISTMASTKVLLRKSKLLKNGEHPIVLRIIKDRKVKFIFTGLSCPEKLWDYRENKPSKKHPNKFELDLFISKKISESQKVILNLENDQKDYSAELIKKQYKSYSRKITVFKFIDEIVADLIKANKIGNASAYKDCKRALSRFRNERDLNFSDIDVSFLKKFERSFSERNVTGNSISVYMRSLRAVFNKAIQEGYCKKDLYPFNEYKISKLNTDTSKRALTKEQMQKLIGLEIKPADPLYDAQQLFIFSYYTRGMNFTDMAMLKWSDITNGRIIYVRAKTGKTYNLSILEPAKVILKHYKKFTNRKKDDYVFPLLNKNIHLKPEQIDYRTEKMNKKINKDLKVIASMAKIDFNLTTYVARHSYATIMKRAGISTSVISESLGHDTEKTTQIYLDSFENLVLDEANKAIL